MELAERTPETRNRYVDFLRAASIGVVVLGHWLMAAPAMDRGELTLSDMLHMAPWTQWLTWAFQVMPLFFIVGGYSNAVSWESARRAGAPYGAWIGARLRRLIGPVVPLLLVWAGIAVAAHHLGVSPDMIRIGSQVALIPTWFLAVYVMVCVAAPATHALWRRFGMASFWGLALGAVLVDALAFSRDLPLLRWGNYAFVWLGVHHVGYVWQAGRIARPTQALAWAAGGLAVLVVLVAVAGYPVSMLTVPGEEVSNSRPPTLALLALGMMHAGLMLSMEAPARRFLRRIRPWTATVLVNGTIMTLYLWHVTAMVLLVGLANLLGGIGLGLQPGSTDWWVTRPVWILTCAGVLSLFVTIFGRFEQPPRAAGATPLPAWQPVVGATGVCVGLAALALGGIGAPGTLGIRIWIVALTLVGAALATGPALRRAAPLDQVR
jgi:fucose 4-O-acetylase-like acetyltransferase